MLRAVIIDDEKRSRETLKGLIEAFNYEVNIVGEAGGCDSGVELIKNKQPELVFLDIQMPDGSGFKLLEKVGEINFEVIFITAYDQFAIKAIRLSALDYLLKPVVPEELEQAIEKAEKRLHSKAKTEMDVLMQSVRSPEKSLEKIVLSTSEGMHIVDLKDIIRCQSEDCYTKFMLSNGKSIMVSKTLKHFDNTLQDSSFIRVHKTHLINIEYIKTYVRSDGGYLILRNGDKVPVSRRKKDAIAEVLKKMV